MSGTADDKEKMCNKERVFHCQECNAAFTRNSSLTRHLKIHTNEKPLCEICDKTFTSKYNLSRHLLQHKNGMICKISTCDQAFNTTNFETSTCSKPSESETNDETSNAVIINDNKIHLNHDPLKCRTEHKIACPNLCLGNGDDKKLIQSAENALQSGTGHVISKSESSQQNPLECKECHKTFSSKRYLGRHLKIHSGIKPFKCEICHKPFIDKSSLKRHLKSSKHMACDVPASFTVLNGCLETSTLKKTLNSEIDVESSRTSSIQLLQNNNKFLMDHEPIGCNIDHKNISDKIVIMNNMQSRQHNENLPELPFETSHKIFEKISDQDKAFICRKCNERFTLKSSLTKHLEIHFGEKSFECSVCHKTFNRKSTLNQHLLIHEKQLFCESKVIHMDQASNNQCEIDEKPMEICLENSKCIVITNEYSCIDGSLKSETECQITQDEKSVDAGKQCIEKLVKEQSGNMSVQQKRLYCEKCNKFFSTRSSLTRHLGIHAAVKPYECEVCHKSYTQKHDLTKHFGSHINEKHFECETCHKIFMDNQSLIYHMKIHTQTIFKCDICHKIFFKANSLRKHTLTHSQINNFACQICHKGFVQRRSLITHLNLHNGIKPFKCELCHKAFGHRHNLTVHLRTHTQEKPFECEICSKRFSENSSLIEHLRRHMDKKLLKCEICNKVFSYERNLVNHMKDIHNGKQQLELKCETCHKTFSEKWKFQTHIKIHTQQKDFECKICHTFFSQRGSLVTHTKNKHLNIKKYYKCEICHKTCSSTSSLATHLQTHTGEKPFECDVCYNSFAQKHHLTNHMRTHTGEKPYTCGICSRNFTMKAHLNAHGKTHMKKNLKFELLS